jgi:peroxiredoxin
MSRPWFAAVVAVLLAAASCVAARAALTGPAVGDPAPDFSLTTLDGQRIALASLRGKTVVLNVFGSWCPPCRLETPDLIAESVAEHGHGVVFVGIDTTETAAVARAFGAAKGIPYPIVVTPGDSPFAVAYDIRNYPTTFVIDPQGRLRARHADNLLPRAQLHAYIVAAEHGASAPLVTAFQRQLDALLDPDRFSFTGDPATVLAAANAAAAAIAQADDLQDDAMDDASRDHDLIRTQEEEAKLRDRAIVALGTIDHDDADAQPLLARLHGDQAVALGLWTDAQTSYAQALALRPDDVAALAGAAHVAGKLGADAQAVAFEERIVAKAPSYATYVALARARAKTGDRSGAYAALDAALPLAVAAGASARAWTQLYSGRVALQLDDVSRARSAFDAAAAAAATLPPQSPAYAIYVEQAQEATIALAARTDAPLTVAAAPWTGADLPGSIASTVKYRIAVTAAPGTSVLLRAVGLPKTWVGSWCTDRVCQPTRTRVVVPASGVKIVEFQVVPDDPKHAGLHPPVQIVARSRVVVSTTVRG